MTWVIWRQYRVTAAIAGAILAAFAVLFLISGLQDAARWHAALANCTRAGTCGNLSQIVSLEGGPVYVLTIVTLAVPLLFGMFWGGPAVARERETATVQFAWTQSVTRRHWLSVKTGWLLLAGAVFGGAVAGIITWWYAPLNALNQGQFGQGSDIQGIVPIGYAVFAVALGIAAGALIGRTLPALAVTAGVFLAVRLMITYWVRVHYLAAVTTIYSVTQNFAPKGAYWSLAQGTVLPGGQFTTNLSVGPGHIISGFAGPDVPASCQVPGQGPGNITSTITCMARLGYRSFTTYQPGYRFWPFQFIETGIFVALAAALIVVTLFALRRRDA
jgi:hypothetical protein